jgi:hypothetical protein
MVIDKGTTSGEQLRLMRTIGAAYYVATGIWPLVHMASFEWVSGKKRDKWLVNTVGVLVALIGAVQLRATRAPTPDELRRLSVGVALGLAAVELYYWRRGTVSLAYALDAVGQLALAGAWLLSGPRRPRHDARASRVARASASCAPRREPGRARY